MKRKTSRNTKAADGLALQITGRAGRSYFPYLRKHLIAAHGLLSPPLESLSLALVGDDSMSELHQGFLGISGPTDVLTFELEHDAQGRVTFGEVVICVTEARRHARERGTSVRQ